MGELASGGSLRGSLAGQGRTTTLDANPPARIAAVHLGQAGIAAAANAATGNLGLLGLLLFACHRAVLPFHL